MKTIPSHILPALVGLIVISPSFLAAESYKQPTLAATGSALERTDRRFLTKAFEAAQEEALISKIVAGKSQNPAIRSFARQLVADHESANRELRTLFSATETALPAANNDADILTTWNGKKTSALDRDYVDHVASSHADLVQLYEKAARKSEWGDIAAFAEKLLPVLRAHRDRAKQMADALR